MSEDLAKSGTIAVVRSAVEVAQAVVPIPRVLLWLAVAVIAAVVVSLDRVDFGKLLREWAKSVTPDPENSMPPIPMPEGGFPIPGDPHTGEQP